MLILYNGNEGGSPEARLVQRVHDVQWGLVRCNAARILRTINHEADAADALEKLPFELWEGTNGFGDKFELLYMKVPVRVYLEVELEADTYLGKTRYENIAQAMAQAGNPVRFIGIDVDTEDSATISTPQLQTKSVAVIRALSDFEVLVSSKGGPIKWRRPHPHRAARLPQSCM